MAKTLIGAQPILQQDLYKAFYNAYMTQFTSSPEAMGCNNAAQKSVTAAADKFSKQLSIDMSLAIYNFVKEIGIQANASGVVISPSGPCTGIIPPANFTII